MIRYSKNQSVGMSLPVKQILLEICRGKDGESILQIQMKIMWNIIWKRIMSWPVNGISGQHWILLQMKTVIIQSAHIWKNWNGMEKNGFDLHWTGFWEQRWTNTPMRYWNWLCLRQSAELCSRSVNLKSCYVWLADRVPGNQHSFDFWH